MEAIDKMEELKTIPDWEIVCFGDVAELKNGINFEAEQKGEVGTLTVDVFNMYGIGNQLELKDLYRINKKVEENYLLKNGDLLFVRSSLKREGVGWTSLFTGYVEPVTFCGFIIRARITDDSIDKNFLTYYFRTNEARDKLISVSDKVAITNINQGALKSHYFPKPPLPEQHSIAHILSLIQSAIQKQEQIINTTTELKNVLMKKLFSEGMNGEPLKETAIGLIPKNWEMKKLGDVANVLSGGTPSRTQPSYWKNGTIPWVKTGEINYSVIREAEEKITEEGYENSSARLCKKGTLLMAMYGQGVTRGRVATLGIDATINQACAAIIPKSEEDVRTMFLYFLFEYNYEKIRTLGHGANQRNLSGALIKLIEITIPKSIAEQDEIIRTIETLNNKINLHKRKKKSLESLFSSSLHQLMKGSIRVKDSVLSVSEIIPQPEKV